MSEGAKNKKLFWDEQQRVMNTINPNKPGKASIMLYQPEVDVEPLSLDQN